jgi:hypothetical protein
VSATYETDYEGTIRCDTRIVCPACQHLHWPEDAPPELRGQGDICGGEMTCARCKEIFSVRRVAITTHVFESTADDTLRVLRSMRPLIKSALAVGMGQEEPAQIGTRGPMKPLAELRAKYRDMALRSSRGREVESVMESEQQIVLSILKLAASLGPKSFERVRDALAAEHPKLVDADLPFSSEAEIKATFEQRIKDKFK